MVEWAQSPKLPQLSGLVLAGGDSTRMGRDKGALRYYGRPQVEHLVDMLRRRCSTVFVSANTEQARHEPYAGMPLLIDALPRCGPASGLLAAHEHNSEAAWLVVAVDLVYLDDATLDTLLAARRLGTHATAFEHPDGMLEPLCTIWEPGGLRLLTERVAAGTASPRRCLEAADVTRTQCPDPRAILSVDTPPA